MVAAQLKGGMLPLGVLIPTRNSMQWLERHLEALVPWLHRVQEVVIVDSQSSDGTAEYLRQHISGQHVKHLSHPPGLYESWSFGLRQIQSEWTYIATVGDSMPEATIEGLVAAGQDNNSDLVISPPNLVTTSGEHCGKQWPIHKFIKWKGLERSARLDSIEVFLWNALSVPGSLLGSSASNIYRSGYIQAHPFPEGFRHACDTAWALKYSFDARWAIAPDLYSELLVHPATPKPPEPVRHKSRERLHKLAQDVFESVSTVSCPQKLHYAVLLNDYWDTTLDILEADRNYTGMRNRQFPWFLYAAAWRERSRRARHAASADQIRARILDALPVDCGSAGSS